MSSGTDDSRRRFLCDLGALSAGALLGACGGASHTPVPSVSQAGAHTLALSARRPRALVTIHLGGGYDAILSTDPKTRSEVDPRADVPYESDDSLIISERSGGRRYGPVLENMLGKHMDRAAVVNGVTMSSVAHPTGTQRCFQMRRNTASGDHPFFSELLGDEMAPQAPLRTVLWNAPGIGWPSFLGPPRERSMVIWHPDAENSPLAVLDRIARGGASNVAARAALSNALAQCGDARGCSSFAAVDSLVERWPDSPMPPIDYKGTDFAQFFGAWAVRDLGFLLANRLTPSIYWLPSIINWDTHANNLPRQLQAGQQAVCVRNFLDFLDRTPSPDGNPLSDEVVVAIVTDLGRFPILNSSQGKDHLPEIPVILIGPGIKPGKYGETDKLMRAVEISLQTGHASSSPRDSKPLFEDVAVTLLNHFGVKDPGSLGYHGRSWDFLLGA